MIHVKSEKEIEKIRESCRIVRDTLHFVEKKIHAGMTTKELDVLIGCNPFLSWLRRFSRVGLHLR